MAASATPVMVSTSLSMSPAATESEDEPPSAESLLWRKARRAWIETMKTLNELRKLRKEKKLQKKDKKKAKRAAKKAKKDTTKTEGAGKPRALRRRRGQPRALLRLRFFRRPET